MRPRPVRVSALALIASLVFMPTAAADSLLIFVSFSMPPASLYGLAQEASKIDAGLILRGLPGDDREEVLVQFHDLAAHAPDAALAVDPALFEDFSIAQVPVFIWPLHSCAERTEQGKYLCADRSHLRLAGDVSLHYVLEKMSEHSEAAHRALLQLRRSGS